MLNTFDKQKEKPSAEPGSQQHMIKQMSYAASDYETAYLARFGKRPSEEQILAWRDGFVNGYQRRA